MYLLLINISTFSPENQRQRLLISLHWRKRCIGRLIQSVHFVLTEWMKSVQMRMDRGCFAFSLLFNHFPFRSHWTSIKILRNVERKKTQWKKFSTNFSLSSSRADVAQNSIYRSQWIIKNRAIFNENSPMSAWHLRPCMYAVLIGFRVARSFSLVKLI